jgi:hypothetical protein
LQIEEKESIVLKKLCSDFFRYTTIKGDSQEECKGKMEALRVAK